jgi:hypothetical protein
VTPISFLHQSLAWLAQVQWQPIGAVTGRTEQLGHAS